MAVRTTAAEVLQILDNCSLSSTIVDVFINDASITIDEVFENDTELSSSQLEAIERWLAAHMIASTLHRQTSKEQAGDASVTYTGRWDRQLESTSYGQMVLFLDTTGRMGNVGKQRASIYAVKNFE